MTVSVKSLQKQLIAAVAMVLVAMIALGSSTYAWFAANNTVTATGMQVTAQSNSTYLLIDTVDNATNKGTSATTKATTTGAATLYPAAYTVDEIAISDGNPNKINAKSWYTAKNKNSNSANDAVIGRKTVALTETDYFQKSEFWLTLSKDSEDATNKTLTINFSKGGSDDAAVSVAVYIGGASDPILLNSGTTSGNTTISLTSTTSVPVVVYTYVDGNSTNVNSDYINGGSTITGTVGLEFVLDI